MLFLSKWTARRRDPEEKRVGQRDRPKAVMVDEAEEMSRKIAAVLNGRRWETPEGPFQGFGSPPGKF